MSRPRVAIGPTDVAGTAGALAQGLRDLGAEAEVVLWKPAHPFAYPADRVLGRVGRVWYALSAPVRRDVFHYQFGATWLPRAVDARWARLFRRTLVCTYHGDDCRLYAVARERFPARGRAGDPAGDNFTRGRLRRMARIVHAALVADLELATYAAMFFERVYLTPLPLHGSAPQPEPRDPGAAPVVLHAPSDPAVKGTAAVEAAARAVGARTPLELRILTGVTHDVVAAELRRADIVVDQLNSVTSGVFALEAMRLGLPVLGELDRSALPPYQTDLPVVAASPETLEGELEALVRDPELRQRLGEQGRAYVSGTHDPARVAEAVLRVYEHAPAAPPGVYEATSEGVRAFELSLTPT